MTIQTADFVEIVEGAVLIIIVFNLSYIFYFIYGSSKKGNPLTEREEILQTLLVKNAPNIFRIKAFIFQTLLCEHHFLSSQKELFF